VFIGYGELVGVKGYKLWIPDEHMSTYSRDVIFREEKPRKVEQQKEKPDERVVLQRVVENQIPSLREQNQVEEHF
jgi:hypothetical protein